MNDYMKALRQRFSGGSPYHEERQEIEVIRQALRAQLDKPQRKLLLALIDGESQLRNQMALDNFISGFRLAAGIARELSMKAPYSFDVEEEDRARKLFEEERRSDETQSQRRGEHPQTP